MTDEDAAGCGGEGPAWGPGLVGAEPGLEPGLDPGVKHNADCGVCGPHAHGSEAGLGGGARRRTQAATSSPPPPPPGLGLCDLRQGGRVCPGLPPGGGGGEVRTAPRDCWEAKRGRSREHWAQGLGDAQGADRLLYHHLFY